MTSSRFTYTLGWKRGSKLQKKIKFLSLLKNENFFKALTLNLLEETILVFLSANYL